MKNKSKESMCVYARRSLNSVLEWTAKKNKYDEEWRKKNRANSTAKKQKTKIMFWNNTKKGNETNE